MALFKKKVNEEEMQRLKAEVIKKEATIENVGLGKVLPKEKTITEEVIEMTDTEFRVNVLALLIEIRDRIRQEQQ
jgi:hypothetical protein